MAAFPQQPGLRQPAETEMGHAEHDRVGERRHRRAAAEDAVDLEVRPSGMFMAYDPIAASLRAASSLRPVHADPRLDVLGEIFGVARHAGEAARAPGVEPGQPEEVDARHGRHAAHMGRVARGR